MILRYLMVTVFVLSLAPAFASPSDIISDLKVVHLLDNDTICFLGSGIPPEKGRVTLALTSNGSTTKNPAEVVLSIDSSSSMEQEAEPTDPERLRINFSKEFVGMMDPTEDKVGVVSWNGTIVFVEPLTSDFKKVNESIDMIDSSGSTNLSLGLNNSTDLLINENKNMNKFIVFISDGDGGIGTITASKKAAFRAKKENIIIHTIGLGNKTGEIEVLKEISSITGGKYRHISEIDGLKGAYQDIWNDIKNITGKDVTLRYSVPSDVITDNYSIEPASVIIPADDTFRVLTWNAGTVYLNSSRNPPWNVSFDVSSPEEGEYILGYRPAYDLTYIRYDGALTNKTIDNRTLVVDCNNSPPWIISLIPNPECPQKSGSDIQWTANATDPDGDPIFYKFWLRGPSTFYRWEVMGDWTYSNVWWHNTSMIDVGENEVRVWVRDGYHEPPYWYDDAEVVKCNVTSQPVGKFDWTGGNWTIIDNNTNITVTKEIVPNMYDLCGACPDIELTIEMPEAPPIEIVFAFDTSGSMKKYYKEMDEDVKAFLMKSNFTNISIISWDEDFEFKGNKTNFGDVLDSLADMCYETDSTVYETGLEGAIRELSNLTSENPNSKVKVIIFVTGSSEFQPGPNLEKHIKTAEENKYSIFAIGLDIYNSTGSMEQHNNLTRMASRTGGEYYSISKLNLDEFGSAISNITAWSASGPIVKNVVITDTLLSYLTVEGIEVDNAHPNSTKPTTNNNPDGTTTVTWKIGDMYPVEFANMTIHTSFNYSLPADVNETSANTENLLKPYRVNSTTPRSKVTYTWLPEAPRERYIEIPAGVIRISCGI